MNYLGIDIGTSGCKVGIFNINGKCESFSSCHYCVETPRDGWMELNPLKVWSETEKTIEKVLHDSNVKIKAIAVSSLGETIFPIGRDGTPLCNGHTCWDNRANENVSELNKKFGMWLPGRTMRPLCSMFTIGKFAWMKLHSQDCMQKAWHYTFFLDYVTFLLSGEFAIDYSMASRTMMFDVKTKKWIPEVLDYLQIEEKQLSKPMPAGSRVGKIRRELADKLGLDYDIDIILGGHDQSVCAYGLGINHNGIVMDSMGTTETLFAVDTDIKYTDQIKTSKVACDCYVLDELYACLVGIPNCGQSVDWLKEKILHNSVERSILENDAFGPNHVLCIPHFSGSGVPTLDDSAEAVFYGLTCHTTDADMYQAIMEGIVFESYYALMVIKDNDIPVEEIRVCGGPVNSVRWMKIKASLYGIPLVRMNVTQTGVLGAAMLAAKGCGDIVGNETPWAKKENIIEPDNNMSEKYREAFDRYDRISKMIIKIRREMDYTL